MDGNQTSARPGLEPRQRLALFRGQVNLTQEEMARALGCSQAMVALIERGERTPGLRLASRIEHVAKIPAADWASQGGRAA